MMVEAFIAFRHVTERKVQSMFSIMGIAIAVTVFLVSLTISNGLEKNMINSILTLGDHITITEPKTNGIENYTELKNEISKIKDVKSVIPKFSGQAIIKNEAYSKGAVVYGMENENIKNDIDFKIIDGSREIITDDSVLIGEEFSNEFEMKVGDVVSIVSSENKELKLKVVGIFKTGYYEYDKNLVIVPLKITQILYERGDIVTEIGIKTNDPKKLEDVIIEIGKTSSDISIHTWSDLNQHLLKAIKFEKFVLIAILSLLLLIASFAVSVILNMIVREKIKDIGILKSIGYSNKNIRRIFTIEGFILGLFGMIVSAILSPLILLLLRYLFDNFMDKTYYLEKLPLSISVKEIAYIYLVAAIVVFVSTIFPAIRASKLKPVEALKHD